MHNWNYSEPNQDYEKQYKYANVVILKADHHDAFKQKLNKYIIKCVMYTPFEKLPLKGVSNCSILYHNIEFSQLLSIVNNDPQFVFSGRYTLTISITQYIRLINRNKQNIMNQTQLNTLNLWLKKLFPKETLRMWMFAKEDGEQEYYMQTGSRLSSLYMYIVMAQLQERPSFNNPKGLEALSDEERSSRFKLCCLQ